VLPSPDEDTPSSLLLGKNLKLLLEKKEKNFLTSGKERKSNDHHKHNHDLIEKKEKNQKKKGTFNSKKASRRTRSLLECLSSQYEKL